MPGVTIWFNQRNYDSLTAICESNNMKTSAVVNWLFKLGNARRQELEAQEVAALTERYRFKGDQVK